MSLWATAALPGRTSAPPPTPPLRRGARARRASSPRACAAPTSWCGPRCPPRRTSRCSTRTSPTTTRSSVTTDDRSTCACCSSATATAPPAGRTSCTAAAPRRRGGAVCRYEGKARSASLAPSITKGEDVLVDAAAVKSRLPAEDGVENRRVCDDGRARPRRLPRPAVHRPLRSAATAVDAPRAPPVAARAPSRSGARRLLVVADAAAALAAGCAVRGLHRRAWPPRPGDRRASPAHYQVRRAALDTRCLCRVIAGMRGRRVTAVYSRGCALGLSDAKRDDALRGDPQTLDACDAPIKVLRPA